MMHGQRSIKLYFFVLTICWNI